MGRRSESSVTGGILVTGAGTKLSKYDVLAFFRIQNALTGAFFTRIVLGLENAESGCYGSAAGTVLYV